MFNLIFIVAAATTAPVFIGSYSSEKLCVEAIRSIFASQLYLPNAPKDPMIEQAITNEMKYQTKYQCIKSQ